MTAYSGGVVNDAIVDDDLIGVRVNGRSHLLTNR
jgi:hypothetical protein